MKTIKKLLMVIAFVGLMFGAFSYIQASADCGLDGEIYPEPVTIFISR